MPYKIHLTCNESENLHRLSSREILVWCGLFMFAAPPFVTTQWKEATCIACLKALMRQKERKAHNSQGHFSTTVSVSAIESGGVSFPSRYEATLLKQTEENTSS